MPLITVPVSARNGAIVRLRVSLNQPTILTLRSARRAIPQPLIVDALIDTGAECCCVDPSVVARIGLPLYSFGLSAAPGTSATPVPALGGTTVGTFHTAGLAIVHPAGQPDLVVPNIVVQTLALRSFGIEAVVGRDVLASCVLVYDGPAGSVTLAY
jgi:hypothetical protein